MKDKAATKTNWPVMVLLILGLITIAFPLYMTIVIALKQPTEMTNSISGILSLPKHFSLSNFAEAMEVTDFWHSLANSLLITLITVALSLVLHSMIGYAIQICIFLYCQWYVCAICYPDDASGETDGRDGTWKYGWCYSSVCGILYADECITVFRISE